MQYIILPHNPQPIFPIHSPRILKFSRAKSFTLNPTPLSPSPQPHKVTEHNSSYAGWRSKDGPVKGQENIEGLFERFVHICVLGGVLASR